MQQGYQPKSSFEAFVVPLLGAVFVLVGLGILGFQAYSFLRYGAWIPMSVIDVGKLILDEQWLYVPREWTGLHWLLDKIPVSIVALLFGYGIVVAE